MYDIFHPALALVVFIIIPFEPAAYPVFLKNWILFRSKLLLIMLHEDCEIVFSERIKEKIMRIKSKGSRSVKVNGLLITYLLFI